MARFSVWVAISIVVVVSIVAIAVTLGRSDTIDLEDAIAAINNGEVSTIRWVDVDGKQHLEIEYYSRDEIDIVKPAGELDSDALLRYLSQNGAASEPLQFVTLEYRTTNGFSQFISDYLLVFQVAAGMTLTAIIGTGVLIYYQNLVDSPEYQALKAERDAAALAEAEEADLASDFYEGDDWEADPHDD